MKNKLYTISTQVFATKEEAKKKLLSYSANGNYRGGSMVMEVSEVYDVEIVEVANLKKKYVKPLQKKLKKYPLKICKK